MTVKVTEVKIPIFPRYTLETELTGYLFENILSPNDFAQLNKFWEQSSVRGIDWDRSLYYYKGKVRGVANQRSHHQRYDRKLIDLPEKVEWHYQTPKTIYNWAFENFTQGVNPIISKLLKILINCRPFSDEPNKWIPHRILLNILDYGHPMHAHVDSEPATYNCPMEKVRQYSVTLYLNELSEGGEFWIDSNLNAGYPGFFYKPKPNTAFAFNGGYTWHGVNENRDKNKQTRRAFTFRFAHVDSLFLPGHPDKFLYKPNMISQITA